ncbi:MAG: histidine kinase dimerization/phospho-acceptor domain-containing protein [Myxococcota bacterium]
MATDEERARAYRRRLREAAWHHEVSHLAHDLATPLNVLSGRLQLLHDASSAEEVAVHLAPMQRQVDKLTRVVTRAREAAAFRPTPREYSSAELVTSLSDRLSVALNDQTATSTGVLVAIDELAAGLEALRDHFQGGEVTVGHRDIAEGDHRRLAPGSYLCVSVIGSVAAATATTAWAAAEGHARRAGTFLIRHGEREACFALSSAGSPAGD